MYMYSVRARIIGNPFEAMAWAQEIAHLASKVGGTEVQVAARAGGTEDLVWVSRHNSMADIETAMTKIQNDSKFQNMVKSAVEHHLLQPGGTEAAFWRIL